MCDAAAILLKALSRYADAGKWVGTRFEKIKRISNTKVGDVGQDFVEDLCTQIGLDVGFPGSGQERARQSPWDICIGTIRFELKTATEDTSKSFQFNHIRYHRQYDALLCVGISPDQIYFGVWDKFVESKSTPDSVNYTIKED